ncbi:MAG TPA: phage tail protein [Kofleriaceae bacterium]
MDLVLGSRFAAVFFIGGVVPNPIDIRFQRVSGLSATIETTAVNEGGQNLYTHRLPRRVGYGNLTLERGFVIGSPLNIEFNLAMSLFQFAPSNVMITLLAADATPLAAWLFLKAYPVRWATADLSASEDKVLIDTLELSYTSMQALRV